MHDRMLSERYELPVSMDDDLDPRPEPDSVASAGLVATHELRGVFPALPPNTRRLVVAPQVATFENQDGRTNVFAAVAAAAGPADTLAGEMVVLDSDFVEVSHARRPLSPSACEAATLRVADFDTALPPGDYHVGLSVHGSGRRGASRDLLHID